MNNQNIIAISVTPTLKMRVVNYDLYLERNRKIYIYSKQCRILRARYLTHRNVGPQ